MRIFIAGATGLIGSTLYKKLTSLGHEVIKGVRHPQAENEVAVDFTRPEPESWQQHLSGCDLAINAIGIFQETAEQTFVAVHHHGPKHFFDSCINAGVDAVVQISAHGANSSGEPFLCSKNAADKYLQSLELDWLIIQPSLVYGENGNSASFMRTMASLPLLALPGGGKQMVSCIHADDLCEQIVAQITAKAAKAANWKQVLTVGGRQSLSLRTYIAALRQGMQFAPAPCISIPWKIAGCTARIADRFAPNLPFFGSQALRLLQEQTNNQPCESNRAARPVSEFIEPDAARNLRQQALAAWRPLLLRAVLAFLWLVTAIVSLMVWPIEDSLKLLASTGLVGVSGYLALYAAILLNLAFGLATLFWPGRKLWLAQLVVTCCYSLIVMFQLPEFLAHPFGPITKNLPVLAILLLLFNEEIRP